MYHIHSFGVTVGQYSVSHDGRRAAGVGGVSAGHILCVVRKQGVDRK